MACSIRRCVGLVVVGMLALSGCGEDDPDPRGGTDSGRDGAIPIDANRPDATPSDSGSGDLGSDGSTPDDATTPDDAEPSDSGPCEPLPCAAPPSGCRYEGTTCTSCGTLVCEDGGTTCVECPDPGECCSYDSPTCESCGEAICFTVDCAAPPPGCHYQGGSCRSCGELVCEGDAGMGGEPCGPVTCRDGLVCCNASCGICTPPGGSCIEIACEDAGMGERRCGARLGDTCGREGWCDFDDGGLCGAADATGVCRPRPDVCPTVFMPVCGCDHVTYGNACEAHASGIDDATTGACSGEPALCAAVLCMEGTLCQVCDAPGGPEPRCLRPGETCEGTSTRDCRSVGCPDGATCTRCSGVGSERYVCLPAGGICP